MTRGPRGLAFSLRQHDRAGLVATAGLALLLSACAATRGGPAPPGADASSEPVPEALAAEIETLIGRFETDATAEERNQTQAQLIVLGPVVVPALLERIEHPDWSVRWKVVNALGNLSDPRSALPLVDRVVLDPNPHVRWRSLWALSVMRGEEARITAALQERLADPATRWNAAVGLSMFEDPAAIPILVEGTRSADGWIRFEAVNGLGRAHDADISRVLTALLDHPDLRTRQEVTMSLGRIGDPPAIDGLLRALADASPGVRWRAAMGLGGTADPRAVEALEKLFETDSDPEVRAHAERALEGFRKRR